MGNVQTESLYNCISALEIYCQILIVAFAEKLSVFFELFNVGKNIVDIRSGYLLFALIFFKDFICDILF